MSGTLESALTREESRRGDHAATARVLYVAYTDPAGYPPLHHSSRMIAECGCDVMILGIRVPSVERLRFPAHTRIQSKYFPAFRSGWRQKLHYVAFCAWVLAWTLRLRPHWIYSSDAMSAPATLIASYVPGARVIYHEHDSPTPNQRPTRNVFSRLIAWARRCVVARSSLCILPQQDRAKWFRSTLGAANVTCVWNCPSRDELGAMPTLTNVDALRVVYQGSIVPDRLPTTIAEALRSLPATVSLHLIGYTTQERRGYADEFLQFCETIGVRERVHYHGPMERRELLLFCSTCDVGLALIREATSDVNMRWMVGASNKPFDYLACGLPLVVTDNTAWRSMYVDAGYAVTCDPDSPESVARALRWYLEHPRARLAMGAAGRRRIETDWNYESRFTPVLQHMLADRWSSACRVANY